MIKYDVCGELVIDIPGIEYKSFDPKETTIQDVIDYVEDVVNFKDGQLIEPGDLPFISAEIRFDFGYVDDEEEEEVGEKIEVSEAVEETGPKSIDLYYTVPKKMALTQRFQDRIANEVPNIIESVYDDCKVTGIRYEDIDEQYMKLTISVLFANENFVKSNAPKYLDENISFIVNDIIDYYNK